MTPDVEGYGPEAKAELLLTRAEATAHLGTLGIRMKTATLPRLWSTGGGGPPCQHIRSKPFYPRELLEASRSRICGPLRRRPRSRALVVEALHPRPVCDGD
ncbi:hypothetical protein KOAAANKH_02423 [Brevundimonas sp. NIBR10]|nr:hypothetical protein KOAAANKH_02423 [Brevundimonas sp. NIBR10]